MTSRKRKIEDALARIAEANGVKEMTMTQGKWVPLDEWERIRMYVVAGGIAMCYLLNGLLP